MEGPHDLCLPARASKRPKKASGGPRLPSLRDLLIHAYRQRGASNEDLHWLGTLCAPQTIARYEGAWGHFLSLGIQKEWFDPTIKEIYFQLESTPMWMVATWLAAFAQANSISQTRNVYSALLMMPCTQQLRFEPTLRSLKQQWNQSVPRYDTFYRVDIILQAILDKPSPRTEEQVREHLILLLRFFGLFRGIDLARCKNEIEFKGNMWFLTMLRKGHKKWSSNPIPEITPQKVNPSMVATSLLRLHKTTGLLPILDSPR